MISQSDIIRTLINKNCTDESVMSTALSPDCTPPRLLEKLTEAERFDLALDISMKLGLDVMPLWRTWALRCLQNRNFQGARDKFRHCFLRLRVPGGRNSPASSRILEDITRELNKMDETQLSLAEEVELIKRGELRTETIESNQKLLTSKPTIYSECLYYLNEYGTIEDHIKFYIRNSIWPEAINILLDDKHMNHINLDKFFMTEVVQYTTIRGKFSHLIQAFLKLDPNIILSSRYFKAIYNFYLRNRKYNLIYYVQNSIGDYVAAAQTQINFFFLRKPVQSYRELNQRLSSLILAKKNYQQSLDISTKLATKNDETKISQKISTNNGSDTSNLFSSMPLDEIKSQIDLIDIQSKITRNFAINEVTGCINGIDLSAIESINKNDELDDMTPVTLFEKSERRKTFLTALVLIYYDLTSSTNFSKNNLELANQLISDHGLDKLKVFKTAMRIIIEDESCDILENASLLLALIKEDYLATVNSGNNSSLSQYNIVKSGKQQDANTKLTSKVIVERSNKRRQQVDNKSAQTKVNTTKTDTYSEFLNNKNGISSNSLIKSSPTKRPSPNDCARALCDEVIRDSIGSCREADYKMELAKLLSGEAKIELYIENGKLSNAQRLAFTMNRPDYVSSIIEEASRLNQDHVKTVCQLWLAKHETRNFIR